MRTSRVSRQTAQVVEALSPKKPKKRINGAVSRIAGLNGAHDEPDRPQGAESPLSSAPTTPLSQTSVKEEIFTQPTSRKRKRTATSQTRTPKSIAHTTSTSAAYVHTALNEPVPAPVPTVKPKKARRQPAKPIKSTNGEITHVEPPPHWDEVYTLTQEMRKLWPAAVDSMGCESLADDKRTPRDRRFQTLIALMLSSQTKDPVTAAAIKRLQNELPGGFCLENVRKVEPALLNSMIEKVGFHNNKTKYIKAAAEILSEKHGSDIPDTIEGLMALPGVGPKMAYLCMSAAWGRHEGIGVDVHVHRITNLWGWHKTQTPEETRAALESWLPKDRWHEINHLLVGFGQTWCPPIGRKCEQCKLSERGLCPSAVVKKQVKEKVKKEKIKIEDETGTEKVEEQVKIELDVNSIKAEDLSQDAAYTANLQDMEDIGGASRRRSRRLNPV